jgi:hypothetical protein
MSAQAQAKLAPQTADDNAKRRQIVESSSCSTVLMPPA